MPDGRCSKPVGGGPHITGAQWNGPKFFGLRGQFKGMSMNAVLAPKRCAVYCRVQRRTLDQSFNSIDAQKEAGPRFIQPEPEGWIAGGR